MEMTFSFSKEGALRFSALDSVEQVFYLAKSECNSEYDADVYAKIVKAQSTARGVFI